MQPNTNKEVTSSNVADVDQQNHLADELRRQLGQRNFDNWFAEKVTLRVDDDELSIGTGSPFLLNWMQKQFRKETANVAKTILGPSATVRFWVDTESSIEKFLPKTKAATGQPSPESSPQNTSSQEQGSHEQNSHEQNSHEQNSQEQNSQEQNSQEQNSQEQNSREKALQSELSQSEVSSKKTPQKTGRPVSTRRPVSTQRERRFADFADFISGPCNEMAFSAATHLAETVDTTYSPLFLHGGVGTGKTHLLEAIYRKIRRETPVLKTVYLTAEGFTNYFTQALRERTLPRFRQRFRGVDLLLVDDIGFLDSKSATQEEFLHTFEQLRSHGRQIVLAGDRHPRLLTKMSEELTTRFVSGLVCRIESPDLDTRLQIVERKAARMNAKIKPEALRYIAQRFQNNVRELEGGLNCLATYHRLTNKPVGVAAAKRVLAELERDCIRAVRIRDVERAVCDLFGVDADDLKSSKRHRTVSQPRMVAMFLSRKLTRAAYSEIGEHFGGRNHSTVMSAERKVLDWIEKDQSLTVAARQWPLTEVIVLIEQQLQAS